MRWHALFYFLAGFAFVAPFLAMLLGFSLEAFPFFAGILGFAASNPLVYALIVIGLLVVAYLFEKNSKISQHLTLPSKTNYKGLGWLGVVLLLYFGSNWIPKMVIKPESILTSGGMLGATLLLLAIFLIIFGFKARPNTNVEQDNSNNTTPPTPNL